MLSGPASDAGAPPRWEAITRGDGTYLGGGARNIGKKRGFWRLKVNVRFPASEVEMVRCGL